MSLIYDIGAYNGDDAAYYLSQGHSVVAVEAVPELARGLCARFPGEIASGRLVVQNAAIAERAGEAEFWICDDCPVWSSLSLEIAGRDGSRRHAIRVPTLGFGDVLGRFGMPYYLKVDIESADSLCIEALRPDDLPRYISAESECGGSDRPLISAEYLATIRLLHEREYRRFRLVNQFTLASLSWDNMETAALENDGGQYRRELAARWGWTFPPGATGPWGEDIEGPWYEFSEAVDLYCASREVFFRHSGKPVYSFWYDWHATL